jgi:hypothetical protein
MRQIIARGVSCVLVLAALVFAAAAPARAQTKFDGNWSVLVITDAGDCDRAYRYGVMIAGGQIHYVGDAGGIELHGAVGNDGKVTVAVRLGDRSASGTGLLASDAGEGIWQGAGSGGRCSGRWEAERR